MSEIIFEARGIEKNFPGVKALDDVHFSLRRGEVHALVGENGAGKSTLMMVLGGIYQPDRGELFINGKKVQFNNPRESIKSGIGIVFQELSLVPQLSVAENIFYNRQPTNRMGLVNKKLLNQKTQEMLDLFDVKAFGPGDPVHKLSLANQQVVEILKAMSEHPQIIILDEPTSSLSETETRQLFKNVRKLKEQGISFIFVSHHLSEIFEIADTVTVLRDGQTVTSAKVSEIDEDFLISNMVGRSISNIYGKRSPDEKIGDVIFEAKGLTRKGVFEDVSFNVRKCEIVGFSGLVGAGRTEIGRAIFGADSLDSGEMYLMGKPLHIHSCDQAIRQGVAYMTEDRKGLGLYLAFNIRQNLAANRLWEFTSGGIVNDRRLDASAEETVKDFNVVTPSIRKTVNQLSGGNQQKVLLAEWMSIRPKLLIVDEPTRGVDVGAKCEIYKILRRMAAQNECGIIMISSDLPEVLGVSDRIIAMKDGRKVGELDGPTATEVSVMNLIAGSGKN